SEKENLKTIFDEFKKDVGHDFGNKVKSRIKKFFKREEKEVNEDSFPRHSGSLTPFNTIDEVEKADAGTQAGIERLMRTAIVLRKKDESENKRNIRFEAQKRLKEVYKSDDILYKKTRDILIPIIPKEYFLRYENDVDGMRDILKLNNPSYIRDEPIKIAEDYEFFSEMYYPKEKENKPFHKGIFDKFAKNDDASTTRFSDRDKIKLITTKRELFKKYLAKTPYFYSLFSRYVYNPNEEEEENIIKMLNNLAFSYPEKTADALDKLKKDDWRADTVGAFLKTEAGQSFVECIKDNKGKDEKLPHAQEKKPFAKLSEVIEGRINRAIGDRNTFNWYEFKKDHKNDANKILVHIPQRDLEKYLEDLMSRPIKLIGIPGEKVIDITEGTEEYNYVLKRVKEIKELNEIDAKRLIDIASGSTSVEIKEKYA
ncbi:MAG: hypothetical protein KAQ92_04985, partial [Candidatus Aenigmarchaeota archaeon]|nr:hypothetical protein [Candidatus Aenigmarchaeota archaeon]